MTATTTFPDQASAPATTRGLKLCLAASGGGHVRQLLDLQAVWSRYDHFFMTEDTALGATLAKTHRTYFVPHYAWGQAKLGAPFRMLGRAIKSFFRSAGVMLRERPDVIISTGAGAVFFPVIWARLLGARVVVIESFARFEKPSLFGRLASPFAHDLIAQSDILAGHYPRAKIFDPFRRLETEAPPKAPLLFATVGATLPFDRLVTSVEKMKREGAIPERVIVQTGEGGVRPEGLETHETLDFDDVQALLTSASIVVCHGGTGSLITALRQGCHVIAMPRLAELGEHYDDHQSEITQAFADRGLITVAKTEDELRAALASVRDRPRVLATTDPRALIGYLDELLDKLAARRGRRPAPKPDA
jgi:UDP-N-acetylglucosamine transferase subunit ALG13